MRSSVTPMEWIPGGVVGLGLLLLILLITEREAQLRLCPQRRLGVPAGQGLENGVALVLVREPF